MTFQITYRGADGARIEETVEAASRAACLAQLKARGIAAVSVREGASGGGARRRWIVPAVLGGLGVAGLALLLAFFAAREAPRPVAVPKAKPPARPKVEKRPAAPTLTAPVVTNTASAPLVAAQVPETEKPVAVSDEEIISAVTNKSGYIVMRVRNSDGTISKRVTSPPPVFGNVSDQMIALSLSIPSGQGLPPMPANAVSDEEFRRSLEEDIMILDTDSAEVRDLKAKVIVAREDIKAMMKKGYSVMQVLQEHHDLFNDNTKLYADAVLEMKAILAKGDREGARKYAVAMNSAFQQMGVPEIPVPSVDGKYEEKTARDRSQNIPRREGKEMK